MTLSLMTIRTRLAAGALLAGLALPAPVQAAAPVVVPLGQIAIADQGKTVTVQASVVAAQNFSSGFKLDINDGTGQLTLLVWADDYDHIYNSYRLNVGALVKATGKVNVYNGAIEIVPSRGGDVQVVQPAQPNWRKYDLGAITGNDHNAVVQVEGDIADITPSGDGAYLLLADNTGAQKVKIYDVVARRIPSQSRLAIGQHISLVGRVKARRKTGVEIVVALPHDIRVLGARPAPGTDQ